MLDKPIILNWPVTDNCNSRCVMCDVWKTSTINELDASSWEKIFSDSLFTDIQYVGISGGEPTLRKDLPELVEVSLGSFPRLKKLTITTHGFHPNRWKQMITPIKRLFDDNGVEFTINVSMDGVGDVHDEIRRIPNGFKKVEETIRYLRGVQVDVQVQSTIISQNVFHIGKIDNYLKDSNIHNAIFRLGVEIPRLDNETSIQLVQLNSNEKSFLADYIEDQLERGKIESPARKLFYQHLQSRLISQSARTAPCFFQNEGILLTALGDMYHCSISTEKIGNVVQDSASALYFSPQSRKIREDMLNSICKSCLHDQSGAWTPLELAYGMIMGTQTQKIMNRLFKATFFFRNLLLAFLLGLRHKLTGNKRNP